ncbi:avt5 [Symbiodinium microadriaticum]|nr:avt5 [Symbiodinium microadriaticum]
MLRNDVPPQWRYPGVQSGARVLSFHLATPLLPRFCPVLFGSEAGQNRMRSHARPRERSEQRAAPATKTPPEPTFFAKEAPAKLGRFGAKMASRPKAVFSSGEARSLISNASEALSVAETSPTADGTTAFEAAKAAKGLGFASARSGAAVLANTLLGGSGLLGVPHAFATAGYGLGLALLVVFGTCSALGCHLLQCSARRIGEAPCSFYSVSNAVAPRWTWLIDGAVMVKCFGVATSYLIIVGDLGPPALEMLGLQVHRWEVICLGFCVAASLACLRNLSGLKFTAVLSLAIVIWTTVLIALYVIRPSKDFNPCGHSSDEDLPCNGADFEPIVTDHPLALGKLRGFSLFVQAAGPRIPDFPALALGHGASPRRLMPASGLGAKLLVRRFTPAAEAAPSIPPGSEPQGDRKKKAKRQSSADQRVEVAPAFARVFKGGPKRRESDLPVQEDEGVEEVPGAEEGGSADVAVPGGAWLASLGAGGNAQMLQMYQRTISYHLVLDLS